MESVNENFRQTNSPLQKFILFFLTIFLDNMLFSSTDAVTQLIYYGANVYTSSGRPESCRNCSSAFFLFPGFFFSFECFVIYSTRKR